MRSVLLLLLALCAAAVSVPSLRSGAQAAQRALAPAAEAAGEAAGEAAPAAAAAAAEVAENPACTEQGMSSCTPNTMCGSAGWIHHPAADGRAPSCNPGSVGGFCTPQGCCDNRDKVQKNDALCKELREKAAAP